MFLQEAVKNAYIFTQYKVIAIIVFLSYDAETFCLVAQAMIV